MHMLSIELTSFASVRALREALPEGHVRREVRRGDRSDTAYTTHRVILVLQAERLDERGFIRNVSVLEPLARRIAEHLHQRNEAQSENPTVGTLAEYIFSLIKQEVPECVAVSISEPPGMWGTYIDPMVSGTLIFLAA